MSISAKLVVVTVALFLSPCPPTEAKVGLQCYLCTLPDDGLYGRSSLLDYDRSDQTNQNYWEQFRSSGDCTEFNEKSQNDSKRQAECSPDFIKPACYVHRKYGRGCADLFYTKGWPLKDCDDQACTCDEDFCNGNDVRPRPEKKKGLHCNICKGKVPPPSESSDSERPRPRPRPRLTPVDTYYDRFNRSFACTNFTGDTQHLWEFRAGCPDAWQRPFCWVHDKLGAGCAGEGSQAFYLDDLPKIMGKCNDVGCKCDDAEFCNGPFIRGERPEKSGANGVQDSARFGVIIIITALGFSYSNFIATVLPSGYKMLKEAI